MTSNVKPVLLASAVTFAMLAAALSGQTSDTARGRVVLADVPLERIREVEATIDSTWRNLAWRDGMAWTLARTPLLADEDWASARGTWTSYLFAYGMRLGGGLSDGQHVSQPWARLTVGGNPRRLSLRVLGDTVVDSGQIQGVHPIDPATAQVLQREPELRQWVMTHADWPVDNNELRALQQFYRTWLANNGIIAAIVEPPHRAFFDKWVRVDVK